jgi:hypothetical protein
MHNPPPYLSPEDPFVSFPASSILDNLKKHSTHFPLHTDEDPFRHLLAQSPVQNSEENEILKKVPIASDSAEILHDHSAEIKSTRSVLSPAPESTTDSPVTRSNNPMLSQSQAANDLFEKFMQFSSPVEITKPLKGVGVRLDFQEAKDGLNKAFEPEARHVTQLNDLGNNIRSILHMAPFPLLRNFDGHRDNSAHSHNEGKEKKPFSACDGVICGAPRFDADCSVTEVRLPAPVLEDHTSTFQDLTSCCPIHFCTHPDGSVQTHFGLTRPSPKVGEASKKTVEDVALKQLMGDLDGSVEVNFGGEEKKPEVAEAKDLSQSQPSIPSPFDIFSLLGLPLPAPLKEMMKPGNIKIQGPMVIRATFRSFDDPQNSPLRMIRENPSTMLHRLLTHV